MPKPSPLPRSLGADFSVREAMALGATRRRLRAGDLAGPFRGTRSVSATVPSPDALSSNASPYERQQSARRRAARSFAPLLRPGQFLSHESAAALWGAPLPLARDAHGMIAADDVLPVHVSTFGDGHLPRMRGVVAHRARPRTSVTSPVDGVVASDPATTWASLGTMPLIDLVALGDFLCREWNPGVGRPNIGMPPLTTVPELEGAIRAGRRVGIRRLREALPLIRTDSWSPRESAVRCHLVFAGLPEPRLNLDVHDDRGRFLGCVDLAYPELKIAIEYQSTLHTGRYAADVERIAALRAAGWIVIEVTSVLLASPDRLVARVRAALRSRRP